MALKNLTVQYGKISLKICFVSNWKKSMLLSILCCKILQIRLENLQLFLAGQNITWPIGVLWWAGLAGFSCDGSQKLPIGSIALLQTGSTDGKEMWLAHFKHRQNVLQISQLDNFPFQMFF